MPVDFYILLIAILILGVFFHLRQERNKSYADFKKRRNETPQKFLAEILLYVTNKFPNHETIGILRTSDPADGESWGGITELKSLEFREELEALLKAHAAVRYYDFKMIGDGEVMLNIHLNPSLLKALIK